MNKIYNKIVTFILLPLLINVIFSQGNYPWNLSPLADGTPGEELVGSDYINFSWFSPLDEYGLTFYISSIQDNGDGEVTFSIAYVNDTYFQPFKSFNIAIDNSEANFVVTDVFGGLIEQENWIILNQGSNIIFGWNLDGQDGINPIDVSTCDIEEQETGHCVLFNVSGTYDVSYSDNNQDEDGNVEPVYIKQVQETTEIFNNQFPPIAQYQWLPGIWFPGTTINAEPENINCICNNDFNSCPYDCPTPYEYQIYRFTFDDTNGNGQLDEGINEHLTFSNPELIGITYGYDEYYDNNNQNAFNYFEDSGLIPEQGYCYYVTDSHSSLSYITQTYLDNVDNQKMCLATECITADFYEDQDNDGLGTPSNDPISQCGAPTGYVANDYDEYPDCPNINGYNPYDCANECFDWNDADVQAHQFEVDGVEWSYLKEGIINQVTYDQMYHDYCESNELVKGCAILEAEETHSGAPPSVYACEGYCALGNTGNELSYFEDVSNYEDNGAPIYVFGGAVDCSGNCAIIDTDGNITPTAWLDDCGWCCSCYNVDDPNAPDDYVPPLDGCIEPYYIDTEDQIIFNDYSNECSYFDNGTFGGHMDCGFADDFTCWHVEDEDDLNGPDIVDDCGECDGNNDCGPTGEIEFFTASVLDDNVTIELDWYAPNFHQNDYSYLPKVAVYISDVIDLNENYNGYDVVEVYLGMENTEPVQNFSIKINSQLLVFYNNQGEGGRAEEAGMSITITSSNNEITGNGQIFGSMIDNPIEPGEGFLTKFRAYINSAECINNADNDPDCDIFLGEVFLDFNNDLQFNSGETYTDSNGNCKWDRKEEIRNDNGNGYWDLGEFWNDCFQIGDKTLCEQCETSNGPDYYGLDDYGEELFCSDPDRYHPFGPNGVPDDPDEEGYDDCPCNEVGVCVLNNNIYNKPDCEAFYNLCAAAEILECQDLDEADVWLQWNSDEMGDGAWNDEEFYIDSNGNNQYDGPEPFFDYGLDGCPDEYENGNNECNDVPDPLLYFEDLNFDNNDSEKNCFYDNKYIDIITHDSTQTAFSDLSGSNLDDYKFLDTEWNKESMNVNKVGKKGDNFCYDSVECCDDAYESHYDGQAEDCPPLIAYKIKRQAADENNPTTIATLIDNTFFVDSTANYDTPYCYTIDTQVLYDIENLDGDENGNALDRLPSCDAGVQDDCLLDLEDTAHLFFEENDNIINDNIPPICGVETGCDFTVMYYDSDADGFGDPDSTQNICNCCFDQTCDCPWVGFQTNADDLWPDCPNDDIDVSPYDCNGECEGNSVLDINGTCCDEVALDICSICYGNGDACLGIDPPELIATGNDDNIALDWGPVDINIDRERNDRELLNLTVLEIDDLSFDPDCGTGEGGNGQECIGRMVFKIFLENQGQTIDEFSIQFNTNGNYALDTIATYFDGLSVFNTGLALESNMNISINENMIFAQSTGTPITGHGVLLYVEGTYDLSITEPIIVSTNPTGTIFIDPNDEVIIHGWINTNWNVGEDVDLGDCDDPEAPTCCGDNECNGSETYFNCPEDCEGVVNYTIRRDGNILVSGIQDTSYVDQYLLEEGETYCYTVLATSLDYSSPPSNEACANLECTNTNVYYLDEDGDGYGDPENTIEDCILPEGYVENSNDQWPDCSNAEIDINPYDCAGECAGPAELDECGICEGPGPLYQECWMDENLDGCYETSLMVTTCACADVGYGDEGDGDECEGEQPEPEAPLYLSALGGYHQIELAWQEPDLSLREYEKVQIVINDIIDNGSGNVTFKMNMSNPEEIQSFNMQILPQEIFDIVNVYGGSASEANMDISFYDNVNIINAGYNGQNIPVGNGLLFNIEASYDISDLGQIIDIEFDNIGFENNFSESVELDVVSSSWIIGSGLESDPLYCGDNICDDNESLNDSCNEDCSFTYMVQINNIIVEDDYTELSYLHSDLGLGEEHCYKVYAKLNEEVVVISPLVCATTTVNNRPVIVSIEDQPDDDGGVVILSIEPIYLDNEPQGYFYEIFRQFNVNGNEGDWVSVDLFGAYGLDLYTVITSTVADSTEISTNEHNFKVRFLDDWSDVVSGYSINNNPPDQVSGLVLAIYADVLIELDWDSNTELDLGYYSVYSRTEDADWSLIEDTDDSSLLLEIPSEITEFAVTASDTTGNESEFSDIVSTGELSFNGLEIPKEFTLYPAYPNPFNPITNIQYGLPKSSYVKMEIYDIMGRSIVELINTFQPAGTYEITWNAENYNSGIYLIRCTSDSKVLTQKILLVK